MSHSSIDGIRSPAPARPRKRRSIWEFSSSELTVILGLAAAAVWITTFFVVSLRQPVLGGDFMQFFTFGVAAYSGNWTIQYDWPAFHALQVSLVPTSGAIMYAPTYPPLVPALYAPFSFLSFPVAYAAWTALSGSIYCGLVALAATVCRSFLLRHALLAALIFPPFIAHVALGQSTVWPLAGFVLGWRALSRSHFFAAGLLLSLVAIKPHLGMALALVLLAMRLWTVVSGILVGLVCQAALTLVICGMPAVVAYLNATLRVLRDTALIEPQDQRFSHALRMSLESFLSPHLATIAWLVASGFFGWLVVRVWLRNDNWTLRMAALLIATLLISPHVLAYDAILLAPATLWLVDWAISTRRLSIALLVVTISVCFVLPAARIAGAPVTLPLMGWLLWRLAYRERHGLAQLA